MRVKEKELQIKGRSYRIRKGKDYRKD